MNALTTIACSLCLAGASPEAQTWTMPGIGVLAPTFAAEYSGIIREVAEDQASFTIRTEDDRERTFEVNQDTSYLLDGEASTKEKVLRTGNDVTVEAKDGVASRVEATTGD